MPKDTSPTWRLNFEDAFGGKVMCEYEYRHALWTILETAGFHQRSILSLIQSSESDDLTFEQIKERYALPQSGDPRDIFCAFIYSLFRQKLGDKLKEALSEFADEILLQAVCEMDRRTELLEIDGGERKAINDLLRDHSDKRKRRLGVTGGRPPLFRSEHAYKLMLHRARLKLNEENEPITKENVIARFAAEDERFLGCDPARITEWNKKFHVDWNKFKSGAL
jgi:hypothetical protein